MQDTTLIYLYRPEEKQILLAMKKRRFGEGKWNGVGGKLEPGESIYDGAMREAREEIEIEIEEGDLRKMAELEFSFQDNEEWDQRVSVFLVEKWHGDPAETEEMKPEWHSIDNLPKAMWVTDKYWLPRILHGEKLHGEIILTKTGDEFIDMKIDVIE
jgi:8-oxo-dGTP pyrophosphatase MutT (NUDIX family)